MAEKKLPWRPTKYKPEYCEQLVDFMAKGMPFETFAAEIDVNQDTLYEWAKVHPDFSEAKKRGRAKQYRFMYRKGLLGMSGLMEVTDPKTGETKTVKSPAFHSTPWIFMMKNCHGWRDKIDIAIDEEVDELEFYE